MTAITAVRYAVNPHIQETIEALLDLGCPPLPVAPKQDPRKSWKQWSGREVYAHHAQFLVQKPKGQTVIVDGERVTVSGEYCRISKTKIQGEDAPVRGDFVRLDENLNPIPRFTGKNPSFLDKDGIPRTLNHGEYQKRLPTDKELSQWFAANPNNGIGTLGGHAGVDWIDFDAKNFPSQEDCDRAVQAVINKLPDKTWVERTGSGGYRIAVRPRQKPNFTNFALSQSGDHVGEALYEGRFTVLAPSKHPNGNNYQRLEWGEPIEIESLESIGVYPAKDEIESQKRAVKREQKKREIPSYGLSTSPWDNPWDIRNFAPYFEGYTEKSDGWGYAKCPHHNGNSLTSFRVNLSTGQYKLWCGCDTKDVYRSGLELAQGVGYNPSASGIQQSHKSNQISRSEWVKRFKFPGEINRLTKSIQSQYDRAAYKYFRRTGSLPENANPHPAIYKVEKESIERQRLADLAKNTTAIVKWEPPLKLIIAPITYIPGQLPSPEEWVEVGCPKVIFRKGDRVTLYAEAQSKGYQFIQDSSGTGKGKSHDSGEISLENLGVEIDPKAKKTPRIFRIDPNYRNPSTATVEERYEPLIARHAGLTLDWDRLTPLGNPYQKRHQPTAENPAPDIAPPCPEHAAFRLMGERDKPVFGGQDSPLCQSCRHFSNCGFLKDRRETLNKAQYISADVNAMSSPAALDIGIIEEAGVNIKPTKKIEVSLAEISATAGRLHLESKDHRIYSALYPILKAVFYAVRDHDIDNKRHGSAHSEVIKSLPSRDELEKLILDQYWTDWSNPQNDPWGNPEWGYKFSQDSDGNWIEESYLEGFNPTAPSLKDLAKECDRLLYLNVEKILSGIYTPEEKAQLIKDNVLFNWVSPLLRVLSGDQHYSVSIKPNRSLQIIKPFKRHQNVVQGFGFAVLLDATSTRDDLALNIGTSPDQLLEISQESPKDEFSNLTINCIRGIKGGRDRIISQKINGKYQKVESENSQETRLKYAIEKIVADHSGEKIGLIDHQQFIKNDSHSVIKHGLVEKFGYWFNESRGSNQFKELQHLIVVGRPTQNLGDLAAEWQSLSGQVKTPTDLTGRYGDWVRRKERSELSQAIGRLRANLRPSEALTAWMINDLSDDDIKAIKAKYPGVKINIVEAYDICPQAAMKGQRKIRGIIEAVYEGVFAGINVTVKDLATQLNTVHSNISNTVKRLLGIGFKALKKMLQSLFKAINRKCDISKTLNSDEIWIAKTYLPMIWEQIEEANDPVMAAEELNSVAQSFGWQSLEAILGATDPSTLTGLLKSMIRCLPKEIHEQLNLSPG
ncbi:MAG: bifunctional DNA primase/polymerase [Microcoleaceae cyanobacterium]